MHEAHVVHHIPGRMRIRMPFLKGAATSIQEMNELLLPLKGLRQVDFSPLTGSVLLHYDPELHDRFSKQLTKYVRSALGLNLVSLTSINGTRASEQGPEGIVAPAYGETTLAREISSFFRRINDDLKAWTNNGFDLKTGVPIGLGIYALLKAGSAAPTPLWVTMGIFSFTSFVILNPVSISVETEKQSNTDRRKKPLRKPTKSQ